MLDAEATQDQDVLVLHLKWMGVSSSLVEQMPSADHKMELVSVIVLQVTLMEIPTKAVLQNPEVRKVFSFSRENSNFFFLDPFKYCNEAM